MQGYRLHSNAGGYKRGEQTAAPAAGAWQKRTGSHSIRTGFGVVGIARSKTLSQSVRVRLVPRALQWNGNPYGNGYGVEMEWKWGTICENRMDSIGFGAECRLKTL